MTTTRILIVEDEKEIADTLDYALSSEGFSVSWADSGQSAMAQLSDNKFDLAILDVGLPDISGFEVLKEIRKSDTHEELAVLILTARSEEIDRVVGFEIGADDYVCKPFSPRELVARVKAILKRTQIARKPELAAKAHTDPRSVSDFSHNSQAKTIFYQEQQLPLTRSEYQLLTTLLAQPGRVFSRRQLIDSVWSSNHPSDDRVIDTHIKTLRAKLRTHNPHREFIKTQRGFGYSIELE